MQRLPDRPWPRPALVTWRYPMSPVVGAGPEASVVLARDLATDEWRGVKIAFPGLVITRSGRHEPSVIEACAPTAADRSHLEEAVTELYTDHDVEPHEVLGADPATVPSRPRRR